jgi:hypothetical protein
MAWVDWEADRDCIKRCSLSTWWDWDLRSKPLHWNWDPEYRLLIRDGVPPQFLNPPPIVTLAQRAEKDVMTWEKVKLKLQKV